jgi:hypothetical protein
MPARVNSTPQPFRDIVRPQPGNCTRRAASVCSAARRRRSKASHSSISNGSHQSTRRMSILISAAAAPGPSPGATCPWRRSPAWCRLNPSACPPRRPDRPGLFQGPALLHQPLGHYPSPFKRRSARWTEDQSSRGLGTAHRRCSAGLQTQNATAPRLGAKRLMARRRKQRVSIAPREKTGCNQGPIRALRPQEVPSDESTAPRSPVVPQGLV